MPNVQYHNLDGSRVTLTVGRAVLYGACVSIGAGVSIGAQTRLRDGIRIGRAVRIDEGAHVWNRVTIGARATVGARTVLGTGSTVGARAIIGDDCTIGARVTIRPRERIPNGATILECEHCSERCSDLAGDDRCGYCTNMVRCLRCEGWVESISAPDDRCNDCTEYYSCSGCSEWVESTDDNGYCESCAPPEEEEEEEEAQADNTSKGRVSHRVPSPHPVMRIGVELEGAWNSRPPDADNYHADGSVQVRGSWRSGEIVSDIMDPSDWPSVVDWIESNYPDRVGASCGLHVHFSFGERSDTCAKAVKLKRRDILEFILARLDKWGRKHSISNKSFWSRLEGQNTYCKTGAWSKGDRYHAVNFEALKKHGTVEIRVLSAFYQSSAAISAVAELVRIMSKLHARFCPSVETVEPSNLETVETREV